MGTPHIAAANSASTSTVDAPEAPRPVAALATLTRPRHFRRWALLMLVVFGVGAFLARGYLFPEEPPDAPDESLSIGPQEWKGIITVPLKAQNALGLMTEKVEAQTQPIRLPLLGTTKHDETRVATIRPLFRGRVEKVHVDVGQTVQPGDPLVDLYSTELAQAKTTFEIERGEWEHAKKLLDVRRELRKTSAIADQLFLDTQNDELHQRRDYEVARDKLLVFGLNDQEVEDISKEQGALRARLTLRSPARGIVISRDVVSGNMYDENHPLLVIAPDEYLWVWGSVFERDLDLVHIGQNWEVQFAFREDTINGQVEYISPGVDPGSHAVRIRTSIPNPGGRLKADMLVRGALSIPPEPGRTVIPRIAMVVVDGNSYAFVRVPGEKEKFTRSELHVAHEKDDHVVVESGLAPGDEVVVVSSLILQQLYEEAAALHTGAPRGSTRKHDFEQSRAPDTVR